MRNGNHWKSRICKIHVKRISDNQISGVHKDLRKSKFYGLFLVTMFPSCALFFFFLHIELLEVQQNIFLNSESSFWGISVVVDNSVDVSVDNSVDKIVSKVVGSTVDIDPLTASMLE